MADLTFPPSVLPVDGSTIDADATNLIFEDPTAIGDSMSVINGTLDYLNMNVSPNFLVPAELVQRGTFADGWCVAGTANLDFRWTWFGAWSTPADAAAAAITVASTDPIQYIPGGNITFYAPASGYALIQWTVMWNNDNYSNTGRASEMVLMVNGAYKATQRRRVTTAGTASTNPQGYRRHRVWTGHAMVAVTEGWYTAGLALLQDNNIRNTRVHARSIQAVWFKE